jgi:uncharacterized RDD family membrane protein YckC
MAAQGLSMDPSNPLNPYAPPAADLNADLPEAGREAAEAPLAGRGMRLGAALIDGALLLLPILVDLVATGVLDRDREADFFQIGELLALGWFVGLSLFQWWRISSSGQSLGKKWLGIRIVKMDGSPVTFGSGVGLRVIVPYLVGGIPLIGTAFGLINIVMIFSVDRRCLHDHLAGTKVIVSA